MPSRPHRLALSKIVAYLLDTKCIYLAGALPTKETVDEQNSCRCSSYGNIRERVGTGTKHTPGLNRSEHSPNAASPKPRPAPTQPKSHPQPQAPPPAPQAPASAPPDASQAPAAGTTRIAPGSVIPVQLTKTIDAKTAKPGDEVVAIVTMDLKTSSGEVIVPKDTKVTGHVTEAQARSKEQKESQLGIAFDHAVLKSGDVNLPMSIQAVIAPPTNNANAGGGDPGAPAGGGGAAT